MKHFERLVAFLLVSSILAGCAVEAVIAPDRVEKDSLLLVDESTLGEIKDESERQAAENDLAYVRNECEDKLPDREITQVMRLKVSPEYTVNPFSYYFCSSKKAGIQMPMIEAMFVDQEGSIWVGEELVGSANSVELGTGHSYKEVGVLGDGEMFSPIIQENLTTGDYIIHSPEEEVLINKDEAARLGLVRILDAVLAIEQGPELVQTVKEPTLIPTDTTQQPTQETEPTKSEKTMFREMFGIEFDDGKVRTFSVNSEGKEVFFRTVPGIGSFEDSPFIDERLFIYENGVWRELERQAVDLGEQGHYLVQWYLDGIIVVKYDAYFSGAYAKLSLDQMKALGIDVGLPLSMGGDKNPETYSTILLNELNADVKRYLVMGSTEKSEQQKAAEAAEKTGYYVTSPEELQSNLDAFYRGEYILSSDDPNLYRDDNEIVMPIDWLNQYVYREAQGRSEYSLVGFLPTLLGVHRDNSRQYLIFGSERSDGQRLAFAVVTGFLNQELYPYMSETPMYPQNGGKFPSTQADNKSRKVVGQDEYSRRVKSKIGKPVHATISVNSWTKDGWCGVINPAECEFLRISTNCGEQVVNWMKGGGVPDYAIFSVEDLIKLEDVNEIPLAYDLSYKR
jgi:hypothetical protein